MPYRNTHFTNGFYYHIFNRGVEKRIIFLDRWDYKRFLKTIIFYNDRQKKSRLSWTQKNQIVNFSDSPLISLFSYCLMSNHFHLLIKQEFDGGISTLMRKVLNSYTKYFNTKYKRVGPLFQGQFKAVLVRSDEHFLHVLRYIHLNPFVLSNNTKRKSFAFPYSSYMEYLGKQLLCDTELGKNLLPTNKQYIDFHSDHLDYASTLESIKHFNDD